MSSRPPASVTRQDVRRVHRRESALLDNFRLVRFLQEDAWKPNEEPTISEYIDAAERRGFTVKYLASEQQGEHMEEFFGIYAKNLAMVALIHGDHMGTHLLPTEER